LPIFNRLKNDSGQFLPIELHPCAIKAIVEPLLALSLLAQTLPCKCQGMKKNINPTERLLTVDEVAEYLSVDRITVYRLLSREQLPGFKVGKQWRFKREMVEAWLRTNPKNLQK
jgi:excisionase family DNA binding protein